MASIGQGAFVRKEFSTLLQDTVERRGLQPADQRAYDAIDRELNQVYRKDLQDYTEESQESLKLQGSREDKDLYQGYITNYKKDSKDAQLRWIRYRDLWTELARLLYTEKKEGFDPALSMKTAVTRARVRELRNDPMGPGDESEEQP